MEYLFVTNQFKIGGVESVFLNIARTIKREIYLLPLHNNFDEEVYALIPSNVKILEVPENFKRSLFILPKLYAFAVTISNKFRGIDLCVINFSDTLTTLLFSHLVKAKKHLSWIHCNPLVFPMSKFFFFYKYLFKRCDEIVCLCKTQADAFSRIFKPKNIIICPNLIDTGTINLKKNEPLDYGNKFIVMVARLDLRSKDFATLISAYCQLPDEITDNMDLVFVGGGNDEESVKGYVPEAFRNKIKFVGNQANPYKWIFKAEFMVHSSKSEGFSMVVVESLACGIPVISSDCVAGPRDILDGEKYGLLFEIGNVEELKQKMLLLLHDKKIYEKYRKLSLSRVEELNHEATSKLNMILEAQG